MIAAIVLVLSLCINIAQAQSGSVFGGSSGEGCISAGFISCCTSGDCYVPGGNCSCDQECYINGDCCDDIELICSSNGSVFGGNGGEGCISAGFISCCTSGDCYVPGENCRCDQECYSNGDCCDDIELICSSNGSVFGGNGGEGCISAGFISCCRSGDCYVPGGNCRCDQECYSNGDCCDDIVLICSSNGVIIPFGENQGDTRAPPRDDGSYHVILSQPFPYFEGNDVHLYVATNGILSFRQPFEDPDARPFPFNGPPLIAPFWDNVDISQFGNIFYRETNEVGLLDDVSGFVRDAFPAEGSFTPTYLFIATWDRVAEFGSNGMHANTFQVALSTDGERSFVLFLYGDIEWGNATIGFNAGDNTRSFTVPGSLLEDTTEIETSSNVGVPGTYIYRVDNSVVLPNECQPGGTSCGNGVLPYVCPPGETSCGNGECITILQQCDGQSDCTDNSDEVFCACPMGEVRLVNTTNGFTAEGIFYTGGIVEVCYTGMYGTICDRGWDERDAAVVCQQLGFSPALYEAIPISRNSFGTGNVTIWFESVDCTGSEEQLTDCAASWNVSNECLSGSRGSAGVICRQVCPFGESPCENGECIFILQRCDGTSDCSDSSDELNCGTNVSSPTDTSGNIPFGESQGDTRAPPRDDGSCHVTLSQPFPFFEGNDVNLYVNTNGILSFQQPFQNFRSIRFPFDSPPLIAPFWDDVDITRFGNIFYRETNEISLLNIVGAFVQETFPAEGSFIPTYLFIATWDSVAQYGGGSQANTFQVVLSTNGERSFVFFLYGDIEWGSATIGFNAGDRTRFFMVPGSLSEEVTDIETTSNVGVPGTYIYRVDPPVVLPNGIRFDQEAYFVNESLSVEICAGLSEIMQFGGIVTFSTEEVNATGNVDYRAITRDLQFGSRSNRRCVQISTFTDNTVEGTEAFLVHLTVGTIEIDSAMIVIVDADNPEVGFIQSVYFINEMSRSILVCAATNAQLQRNFTLLIRTEENTATENTDYEPVRETVVFAENNKRHCITITLNDDTTDEDTEKFFVRVSGVDIAIETQTLIQVTDDDTTTFLFTESTYVFSESTGNATVCARTGTELERTIILNMRTSAVTATDGSDYEGVSRDLTFDADHNTHCIDIPILQDQLHEDTEMLSVILSGTAESTIFAAAVALCPETISMNNTGMDNVTFATSRVTLLDDDAAGIGFEKEVYIVRESQGIATVSAVLNVTLDETRVEAAANTEDITAIANSDYSRTTSHLTFNSGGNRQGFDIRILTTYSNPSPEGAESFLITLSSEDTPLFLPNATVVILDTHFLYEFGEGEGDLTIGGEGENLGIAGSPLFHLQQSFPFFGENETKVYVNTNGIISFEVPFINFQARPFPLANANVALIAPYWDNAHTRFGTIYYRETNDSILLQRAHEHIQQAFPLMWRFFPTSLFIATWDRITFEQEENTFQVVMVTDGELSFVIFIYGDIQWATNATTIGFNAGDGVRSFEVPRLRNSRNIETTSNIGTPGVYVYRVDQPAIISPDNTNCTAGELRLVEEAIQGAGILEVCSMSEWERQCVDETWNDTSASAVCRQLGFLGGVAVKCIVINSTLECASIGDESGAATGSLSGVDASGSGSASPNPRSDNGSTSGSASGENMPTSDGCPYSAVRCTVASVGLDEEHYTVREDAGFLNVCVALDQPLERSLTVTLLTAESGTAKGELILVIHYQYQWTSYSHTRIGTFSDFSATSTPLTFEPAPSEQLQCVEIAISDDDTIESNETFLVLLTTVEQAVSLDRQYAFVTIVDDDLPGNIEMSSSTPGTMELMTTMIPGLHPSVAPSVTVTLSSNTATPTVNAMPSQNIAVPLAAGLTTGSVVLIIVVVLTVSLLILWRKRTVKRKDIEHSVEDIHMTQFINRAQFDTGIKNPYTLFEHAVMSTLQDNGTLKQLSARMLIPCKSIQLLDSIGQGEFGIVYKAYLIKGQRRGTRGTGVIDMVAVKTLKGFYDQAQVSEMMRESLKMVEFNHPNVLNLIGVCLDGGPAPYIVLPFMSNGSLLSYLRKERPNLLLGEEADEEEICAASKRLLDMCIQIAKGMEYLASKNFVHRDLAARNCMIDMNFVIKVADFGLSENTYAKTYFRQGQGTSVKLPIKWLSLESLNDGVFSEKTDVWAFGVTCWEVYSAGKGPYPGLDPMNLIGMLENGHRLDKPKNAACCDEIYSIMLSCWNANPKDRPPFSELVRRVSGTLEPLADYMDFTSFGIQTQSNTAEVIIENPSATAAFEEETAEATNLSPDSQPQDSQSPDLQPQDSQAPDSQPQDSQSPNLQPLDSQAPDSQSPDLQPQDSQSPDSHMQAPDSQPQDSQPPDSLPPTCMEGELY